MLSKGDDEMKTRSTVPMYAAKTGYIVMSAAFCVIGLVFIMRPDLSARYLGYLLGIALTVFGAVKLVGYFSKDLFRLAFQYDLALGVLSIVLGAVLLIKPFDVLSTILIAAGVTVLADSLFKIQIAAEAKRFGVRTWWLIMALAVLTAAAGAVLVIRPRESALFLTMLLGVSLMFEGILNFCVAISTVRIVKNQVPDVIDVEFHETGDDAG